MKRVRREKLYPIIKRIKPFFWKECRFCNREFKREIGYEIEDMTVVNPRVFWSYCCNECAKSIDDVAKLVNSAKLRKPPRYLTNGIKK
ncbi:hypothetical protein [Maledivibacter halophilus]|nr:hypothetical protein [Maledivibacter halophilus]